MKGTYYTRYLNVSGSGSVNFQVPLRSILRSVVLSATSSVSITVPGTGVAQIRTAGTTIGASGVLDVLATIEQTFRGLASQLVSSLTVEPHLLFDAEAVLTLITLSPGDGVTYADAIFVFEVA